MNFENVFFFKISDTAQLCSERYQNHCFTNVLEANLRIDYGKKKEKEKKVKAPPPLGFLVPANDHLLKRAPPFHSVSLQCIRCASQQHAACDKTHLHVLRHRCYNNDTQQIATIYHKAPPPFTLAFPTKG